MPKAWDKTGVWYKATIPETLTVKCVGSYKNI